MRLTTGPLTVDAAWTASHQVRLPAWCLAGPPCPWPSTDTRSASIAGAAVADGDALILAGTQRAWSPTGASSVRGFVIVLQP